MPADVPPWGTPDEEEPPARVRPTSSSSSSPTSTSVSTSPRPGTNSGQGAGPEANPDYGTPPPALERRHARHSVGRGGPTRPAVSAAAALLLGADTVVVVESAGFLSAGSYHLTTADDVPLGSLLEQGHRWLGADRQGVAGIQRAGRNAH
jgi:hypothetical protein